jgi:lipopolysaccharide/colanic/teichoic acid biosynthesis glycosyltransferase
MAVDTCPLPDNQTEWESKDAPLTGWWRETARRATDVALASAVLVLTAPIVLLAAALVRLTSAGPAFYTQARLGLGGRPFTIYKLRSMTHNCEAGSGAKWAEKGDPRVTPVGRWLRRLHIDELPQLWNVLRGDMSLIGPRPERPEIIANIEKHLPDYRERLLVRPGLTGLAQIQLPPDNGLDDVRRKLVLDRCYVRLRTPWLDARIMAGTALYLAGVSFGTVRQLAGLPAGDELPGVPATEASPA